MLPKAPRVCYGGARLGARCPPRRRPALWLDRDTAFSAAVVAAVESLGLKAKRTSYQSPWQNGVAERFVGTVRRDLLDHAIVLDDEHLRRLLSEYLAYYHSVMRVGPAALARSAPVWRSAEDRGWRQEWPGRRSRRRRERHLLGPVTSGGRGARPSRDLRSVHDESPILGEVLASVNSAAEVGVVLSGVDRGGVGVAGRGPVVEVCHRNQLSRRLRAAVSSVSPDRATIKLLNLSDRTSGLALLHERRCSWTARVGT